jgi:hypothetical protein
MTAGNSKKQRNKGKKQGNNIDMVSCYIRRTYAFVRKEGPRLAETATLTGKAKPFI